MHGQVKGWRVLRALNDTRHGLVTLDPAPSDGMSRVGGEAHRPDILDLLIVT